MKKSYLLYPVFFLISFTCFSQQYGSFIHDTNNSLTVNYVTWWKITTGPADGGVFTHVGYWHDDMYDTCDQTRMSIWSHDTANNKPDVLLAETASATSVFASYNNKPLLTQPTLDPNTVYWVAFKGNTSCYTGEEDGAYASIRYKSTTYNAPWPTSSGLSTLSNAVLHTIYAIGNGMPLPVEMISFTGKLESGRATLEWTTAVEMNNEGWNIQRSSNGFTWTTIGWVYGSGNTREEINYSFEDEVPNFGANFYRLEQKDFDGKTAYSDVVSVNRKTRERKIFPNPVQDELYHTGIEEGQYFVHDITGRSVQSGAMYEGTPIDLSNLREGVYSLITLDGYGVKKRHSIIKRK